MSRKIKTIGIVGAGRMGAGIAQTALTFHFDILLYDVSSGQLDQGIQHIQKGLELAVEKGSLPAEERKNVFSRLKTVTSLEPLKDADVVIEAVPEIEALKRKTFHELDLLLSQPAILASNTSSISITRLGSATRRPDRVIGMHFMNPVPVMKLVEVIPGLHTSPDTRIRIIGLARALGKIPVESRDTPGFIVNRVLMPMINEAVFALMEQVASPLEIDRAMKLGASFPMGPLELADLIGLDICLDVCELLHRELGESKYRPCPLLRKYVEAGWLGRKTKKGFYTYPEN